MLIKDMSFEGSNDYSTFTEQGNIPGKKPEKKPFIPESPDSGLDVFDVDDFISNSSVIGKRFESYFRRK